MQMVREDHDRIDTEWMFLQGAAETFVEALDVAFLGEQRSPVVGDQGEEDSIRQGRMLGGNRSWGCLVEPLRLFHPTIPLQVQGEAGHVGAVALAAAGLAVGEQQVLEAHHLRPDAAEPSHRIRRCLVSPR